MQYLYICPICCSVHTTPVKCMCGGRTILTEMKDGQSAPIFNVTGTSKKRTVKDLKNGKRRFTLVYESVQNLGDLGEV